MKTPMLAFALSLLAGAARAQSTAGVATPGTEQAQAPEAGPRSPGLMIGGAAVGAASLSGVIAGVVMAASGSSECAAPAGPAAACSPCDDFDSGMREAFGVMIASIGGVAIAGGGVMTFLGMRPQQRSATAEPSVRVGVGTARLDWHF